MYVDKALMGFFISSHPNLYPKKVIHSSNIWILNPIKSYT